MLKKPGLLEKQSSAFANSTKPQPNNTKFTELVRPAAIAAKLPKSDQLLENTLANNIEISELLTKRESEILHLIISGKTNKEIAKTLCRTQRTIEYHRNRIMHKLGARNAVDLAKKAIAIGIA